jgi:hypothetical protein
MRTTVELSEPLYKRLKAVAVDRGLRGFSPIIEEALSEYLWSNGSEPRHRAAAERGRGLLRDLAPTDVSMVDELIAERRREAAGEDTPTP